MNQILETPRIGWGMSAKLGNTTAVLLELAVAKLRGIARECAECHGTGETRERLEAFRLTDDPRITGRPYAMAARLRIVRRGPVLTKTVCGAGVLRTPCTICRDVRQVIERCEVFK